MKTSKESSASEPQVFVVVRTGCVNAIFAANVVENNLVEVLEHILDIEA